MSSYTRFRRPTSFASAKSTRIRKNWRIKKGPRNGPKTEVTQPRGGRRNFRRRLLGKADKGPCDYAAVLKVQPTSAPIIFPSASVIPAFRKILYWTKGARSAWAMVTVRPKFDTA